MIRVFVADEHAIVRDGLRRVLSETADLVLAGEAETGEQVLQRASAEVWDVLIMGMICADCGGVTVLRRLHALRPDLRTLVFSARCAAVYTRRALDAGATGFVDKRCPTSILLDAVREVHAGRSCPTTRRVAPSAQPPGRADGGAEARAHVLAERWGLTARQREVLTLLAEGACNKDIAARRGCAEVTVEFHVTALLRRAGVQGRGALIARFWSEDVFATQGFP
jgi:two-component system, NarL family, invasion response regulator UvrY